MKQKSANAILKIAAIFNFFLGECFLYILSLCTTNWLLQIEKKLSLMWQNPLKKVDFFPKMTPS
jgi:hypothetical protein